MDWSGRGGGRGGGVSPHSQLEGSDEVGECLEGSLILRQFVDAKRKGDGQGPDGIYQGYGHCRGGGGRTGRDSRQRVTMTKVRTISCRSGHGGRGKRSERDLLD